MTQTEPAMAPRDFESHLGLWIALSHFLPADHVHELAQTTVRVVSAGKLTLDDITDNFVLPGPAPLTTWITRPRKVEGELVGVLQQIVRVLAWQNDNSLHYREDTFGPDQAARLADVAAALELALADFGSIATWERNHPSKPEGLLPLVEAVNAVAEDPASGGAWMDAVNARTEALPVVLRAIVLKHLGDLCSDQDCAAGAVPLYEASRGIAGSCDVFGWRELAAAVGDMATQSLSEATRILTGSAAAAKMLDAAIADRPLDPQSLRTINVPLDLLNLRLKGDEIVFPLPDYRPSVLMAPQLYVSHDLGSALEYWTSGKHRDAHRRFWAVLRRRMAIGSGVLGREAMTYYARALLDDLNAQVAGRRDHDTFALGVKLLLMGGRAELIGDEAGAPELVAAYLNPAVVAGVVELARRYPGTSSERHLVLVKLLEAWAGVVPSDRDELASRLLKELANIAKNEAWSFMNDRDMGRAAFKALEAVGKRRPELRLVSAPVAEAVIHRVKQDQFLLTVAALDVAVRFLEGFEPEDLKAILKMTLDLLEAVPPGNANWALISPGMAIVGCDPARALWQEDERLGRRSAKLITAFGLETISQSVRLLALLNDIEPFLEQPAMQDSRFAELIATLRGRTGQTNSSGVVNDISALFAAPKLSGKDGIRDAINWLITILGSADRTHPSIALSQAYDPLIYLTQQLARIRQDLDWSEDEEAGLTVPLKDALVRFWADAAERTAIFVPFSIPPTTEPNEIVIHNWAFATLGFGRAIGAYEEISSAIATAAANNPELRRGIDLARASRLSARDLEPFDLPAIEAEGHDAYYTALGSRLARLAIEPDLDKGGIVNVLLRQCLRLGPNGMDAAVFSRALELRMRLDRRETTVAGYEQRLSRLPNWRRGLLSLLSAMMDEDVGT